MSHRLDVAISAVPPGKVMAEHEIVTRDVPPLSLRAEVRPGSVDVEKRTVDVVWTTGARVLRGGFWTDPFYEELSLEPGHVRMGRLNGGAPFLDSHNGYELSGILGTVERGSASVDGKKGRATVRFARAEDDPNADAIFRKVKDGIISSISVGYRVYKYETVEKEDEKVPTRRATDWEPFELSAVPMGADAGAGFRGADQAPNPCRICGVKESRAMADPITTVTTPPPAPVADPTERLVAEAREANQRVAEANGAVARDAAQRAAAAERERIAEVTKLVRRTTLGDAFAEKVIKAGTPVDEVRKIVLDELARASERDNIDGHVRFEAGDDARDKFIRGGVASILVRAGHSDMIEAAKTNKRVGKFLADASSDPGEFAGMRLIDLARASLERRGISTRGLHGERLVERALQYRGDSGFNSTGDFTVLLETAVNKIFLGRYATIPVTWPMWCARKSVQDFRTSTFYRPGSFGTLDSVSEQGEVKHKNIPDGAKATLTPATKANIIGITRRALVNDDLGAFRDLAAGLGEAAARTVEADAWALITAAGGLGANAPDGVALFNAAHANIGSAGAMSVATLDSMRAKMALQKDPSAVAYLALRPSVLLVPVELGGTAKVFNTSAADPTDYKNSAVANKVQGLFPGGIIDSPYLSASSATRHYALADPNLGPVFAVGFIDGREAPDMKTEESLGYDGVQMRVILDYATAVLDYRGGVTCAGA